jgi:murein DD-endopeptidase MepM/ murein hydrolase activator NlpD
MAAAAAASVRAAVAVPERRDPAPPQVRHAAQPAIAGATRAGGGAGRHLVLPGDSLPELAARYGVPAATLAKVNALKSPFVIRPGQVLEIPAGRLAAAQIAPAAGPAASPLPSAAAAVTELPGEAAVPAPAVRPAMTPAEVEAARRAAAKPPPALSGEGFLWPVRGEIASGFGEKPNGARNAGVNILAPEGTAVAAAENGVVVYAGDEIPGYGNMLLISHKGGTVTAYAHGRDLLVRVGDVVRRGQAVATVGRTGGIGVPQLHFELREGKKPVDPMAFLDTDDTKLASTR